MFKTTLSALLIVLIVWGCSTSEDEQLPNLETPPSIIDPQDPDFPDIDPPPPPEPPYVPAPANWNMQPGEVLNKNQFKKSSDNRFKFILQNDGNLVLYKYGWALWSSGTHGLPIKRCIMQTDGNLVLYDYGNNPRWSSGTHRYPGSWLNIQNDGNVVIYRGINPVWATNTCCH